MSGIHLSRQTAPKFELLHVFRNAQTQHWKSQLAEILNVNTKPPKNVLSVCLTFVRQIVNLT
jgi:hypothetical protein